MFAYYLQLGLRSLRRNPILTALMVAGIALGIAASMTTLTVLHLMGADPIRVLVVPRLLACVILLPILTIYSDMLGVLGGWLVAVKSLGIPEDPYWRYSAQAVDNWQILEGLAKAMFFGGAIGLISCYKGFTCGAGASGVGRACTESFVTSFLSIIVINLFAAKLLQDLYVAIFGLRGLFD